MVHLGLGVEVMDSYLICGCCGFVGRTEAWRCVGASVPPGGVVPEPYCTVAGAPRRTGEASCGPWRQVGLHPLRRAPRQGAPPWLECQEVGAEPPGLIERSNGER